MKSIPYYERLWLILATPVLACSITFYQFDAIKVCNLLNIQFSKDFEKFKTLINGHSSEILTNNHYFDFFFIILYTALFTVSIKLVFMALDFKIRKRWFFICLIPGLFDAIENVLFLALNTGRSDYFEVYYWVVRLKWAILTVYVQIMLAILLFYILLYLYRLIRWISQLIKKPKSINYHTE